MSIFRRNRGSGGADRRVVPDDQLRRLASIGRAAYQEQGFPDASAFYLSSFTSSGAGAGGEAFDRFVDRLLTELADAAAVDPDPWALAGALYVAIDFDGANLPGRTDGDRIILPALRFLAGQGYPTSHIPPMLMSRWTAVLDGR